MLIGLVWFTFLPLENWAEKGLDISFIISCLSGEGGWSEYGESMNKKKKKRGDDLCLPKTRMQGPSGLDRQEAVGSPGG